MKQVFFLLLISPLYSANIVGQPNDSFDKIIVDAKTIFESHVNEDKSKTIKIIDVKPGENSKVLKFSDLENSLLFAHPLAWDVVSDSILFLVRTYSDRLGMSYTDLLKFNIDTLKSLEKSAYDKYLSDNKRIVVKHISPLFMYALRIAYRADTIKGPVYFDMHCNRSNLSIYVYIDDNSSLEKWSFNWYPALTQILSPQETEAMYKKEQWEKTAEYSVKLEGPFKIFGQAGKSYIITQSLEVYYLSENGQALKIKSIKGTSNGNIVVFDKEKDQVRVMARRLYNRLPDLRTKESIIDSSKKIILKR